MNAEDARKLTIKATNVQDVSESGWLGAINKKIEAAAKRGECKITHPFTGFRMPAPTEEQKKVIFDYLEDQGYAITHQDDSRNGIITSIEW